MRLSYLPGRDWQGEVEYIYPSLDQQTRTLKVRLRFDNPDEALKPNMFADVTIFGGAKKDVLLVRREALIRTGQEQRVILDVGDGRFQPRRVNAGIESGDYVEIVHGLREGDRVVTSGQFLIDSEASLKASILRMREGAAGAERAAEASAPTKPAITGTGVIKAVMPEEHKLNMAHDPIEGLGWPSMVMDFRFAHGALPEGLAPGDPVEFELEEGDGGYVITSIRKRGN